MTTHAASASNVLQPMCGQHGLSLELSDNQRHVDCKRCLKLLGHNTITVNQKREELGLNPIPSGDVTLQQHMKQEQSTQGERARARQFRVRVVRPIYYTSEDGIRRCRFIVVFNGSEKAFTIWNATHATLDSDRVERAISAHETGMLRNVCFKDLSV